MAAWGQGCEAVPAVRDALACIEKQGSEMKFAERMTFCRKSFDALLAKYPREIAVHRPYVDFVKKGHPEEMPALRTTYQQQAEQHPKDAVAVYLAGYAMQEYKTPESIRLVEKAKALDAAIPWPYITLASLYGSGKYADKAKAAENIAGYYRACPDSLDHLPLWMAGQRGRPELQASVAKRVRLRLEQETDPRLLQEYQTLWGLEFRLHPLAGQAALRKQVAEDVKRLEKVNAKPDATWLDLIKAGLRQSGASKEAVGAVDERILREFPSSGEALRILVTRWNAQHPLPASDSPEPWDAYYKTAIDAVSGWIRQFPKEGWLKQVLLQDYAELPSVPRKVVVRAAEDVLKGSDGAYGPGSAYLELRVAQFYLRKNIETRRALELLKAAEPWFKRELERRRDNDRLSAREIEDFQRYEIYEKQEMQAALLKACARLKKVEEARRLKPELEGPAPKDAPRASQHWANLARYAEIEGRHADALACYQNALLARGKPPEKRYGRVEDALLDDSRKLWQAMGGTDFGFALWTTRPRGVTEETAATEWERPGRNLAPFELADLAGKKWTSNDLLGKTVFINIWATWCGTCMAELPQLQKLHDRVKERGDVVILTLNMDQEAGVIEPFVKEKDYKFPVLPAYQYLSNVMEINGIPRNWIVDANGKWQWEMVGFDASLADWTGAMLAKLESVREAGKAR